MRTTRLLRSNAVGAPPDWQVAKSSKRVYGLLGDLVLDAHIQLKQCECIPQEDSHSNFRSPYHRTGTLECMAAAAERRTQRFQLATGEEYFPAAASTPGFRVASQENPYGFGREGEIAAWQTSDPARLAENILYRAKRILCKDKHHQRMMFIRDGHGLWHNASLFARDSTEKHLLMRLAAGFVERKGCDALIEVGEVWIAPIKSLRNEDLDGGRSAKSREALFVGVMTREGYRRTYITPFRRGPFGGIKLADSQDFDDKAMLYLQPIIDVWRRQGYLRLPDGGRTFRTWEPDPLDVCFCGGPKRFAECCKEYVTPAARFENLIETAVASSDFALAERYARATVARYVVWVKQHTVPTMNLDEKMHRELVNMDILALQAAIHGLARAQDANGTAELLVPQLRHLSNIIGIPRLSVRLTTLASEWLFQTGRAEEGVLELDRLRDLDQIDDSLALVLAARLCDLDPDSCEKVLRRAPSVALSKGEKWTSELALAQRLFSRGEREESLRLAEAVIAESSGPDGFVGVLSEASLLRWRITKAASDFQFAKNALEHDSHRTAHAGVLIDEGMYDDAEELLAESIEAGDLTAKLLIIDARIRTEKLESARVLFLTIDDDHVPARLQHPYAVAAALLALALKDHNIRCRALLAFGRMPVAAVEADKGVQSFTAALNDEDWAEG
jgi:hypothetical protein